MEFCQSYIPLYNTPLIKHTFSIVCKITIPINFLLTFSLHSSIHPFRCTFLLQTCCCVLYEYFSCCYVCVWRVIAIFVCNKFASSNMCNITKSWLAAARLPDWWIGGWLVGCMHVRQQQVYKPLQSCRATLMAESMDK